MLVPDDITTLRTALWVVIIHKGLAALSVQRTKGAAEGRLSQNTILTVLKPRTQIYNKIEAGVTCVYWKTQLDQPAFSPAPERGVPARVDSALPRRPTQTVLHTARLQEALAGLTPLPPRPLDLEERRSARHDVNATVDRRVQARARLCFLLVHGSGDLKNTSREWQH